jgi:hypothetical protein
MNKPQRMEYRTVSGAWTPRPVYYCAYHKGYLTEPQARQHHCTNKHGKGVCVKLCDLDRKGIKMTHEQRVISFLEKILNKLISIDTNISRLQKQVDKIQIESKRIDMIDQPSETALDVEGGR